ncbi:acetyl/propionyl/methylcrotonyl-CoA carboxylase subunit alpha [Actinocorallia longicatena]|uniref:Biotin carboxylase N-terminal domain-containing protein n=1 Tax=Actinocorallia longicatena TaxID=111803 RepID=A0ABP6Q417_9ACTN
MITRVLVANRGEIARRVFRSARSLGIATAAVFSEADAGAPHAVEADASAALPGSAPADTYLRGDLVIEAALAMEADAVHPGYGFLSENAGFARAVVAAGLTWVGPPPSAIEAMGSKIEAKKLMAAAGVPTLPELDPDRVVEADLPILVKASAGGGGRGMRTVRELSALAEEVASARREAQSAFGDPAVFCEPLLERARHVEVQILADSHGTVWALGERECSIQRRHQKIVEEAPSPAVDDELRARLSEAAVEAARAIGYVGAGTVEFMLAEDGRFFFLEVNTRLQVEHPVTEAIYGLDLVALQLGIAEGDALPAAPPVPSGHAIEVRLYAEDPALDWRPASGTLHAFEVPGAEAAFETAGLRLDAGVEAGSVVGVHYDPMLAKLIAHGPTRQAAIRRLARALRGARIHGVTTNRDLLVRVLEERAFGAGETHTGYLDQIGLDVLSAPLAGSAAVQLSALAAALADAEANRRTARVLGGLPSGWRNLPSQPQRKVYEGPDGEVEVAYRLTRDGLRTAAGAGLVEAEPDRVVLDVAGIRRTFSVAAADGRVFVDSDLGPVTLTAVPRFADPSLRTAPGALLAPMPGTVVRVAAEVGGTVGEGAVVVVLEAMKMEHRITAPTAGSVAELNVVAGQQVEAGAVLAVIEESS